MLDCTEMTWEQLADVIRTVWWELKRRNPIGVNLYAPAFSGVINVLDEVEKAEREDPTCEAGPGSEEKHAQAS
jgi:hypothetical protein